MKRYFCFFLLCLLLGSCAQIVAPTGGPKDITPPEIVTEQPENKSVFFTGNTLRITFDEFVTLNNPTENIFFSPLLPTNPEFIISGKSLIVKLKDTLISNKTYNVVFLDAIKDFHEGNLLNLYQYTFSTGAFIDSFMLKGELINAETLEPEEGIFVFLYEEDIDSLPLTTKPVYLTKTQKNGKFIFECIENKEYKIFALKDLNGNLIFDLPNEGIAFLDTLVKSYPIPIKDTTVHLTDSVKRMRNHHHDEEEPHDEEHHHGDEEDDVHIHENEEDSVDANPGFRLWYFLEEDTVQRLDRPQNPQKNVYKMYYKRPVDSLKVRQLNPVDPVSYVEIINQRRDTITWYFKTDVPDSLLFELTADHKLTDTVLLKPYRSSQSGGRARRAVQIPKLNVTYSNAGDLFSPLILNFSFPIQGLDSIPMIVMTNKKSGSDTTLYHFPMPDTILTSFPIQFTMEEKVPYTVLIRDSLFMGLDGTTNDTVRISFTSKSERDYGNLIINYALASDVPHLVQLLDNRKNVIQQDVVTASRVITYRNLASGNYNIKVIEDMNHNGKWDVGNYAKKLQPEKILFFDKVINIRGNWDLEENFDIDAVKAEGKISSKTDNKR